MTGKLRKKQARDLRQGAPFLCPLCIKDYLVHLFELRSFARLEGVKAHSLEVHKTTLEDKDAISLCGKSVDEVLENGTLRQLLEDAAQK